MSPVTDRSIVYTQIIRGDEYKRQAAMDAFEVLVRDQAAPKNSWSNTLYSEDGKYTFTKTERDVYKRQLKQCTG